MDALFKKYFWVLNLAAIALMALLVATGINDYLSSKLFAVPSAGMDAGAEAADGQVPAFGRVPAEETPAVALKQRRVFSLDPRKGTEPVKEPEVSEPTDAPPDGDGDGPLEESDLPIDLLGTLVAEEAEWSMATLRVQGNENKLARLGDELVDGDAKLVTIGPRHVIVEEKGKRKVIKLWTEKQPAKSNVRGPRVPPTPVRNPRQPPPPVPAPKKSTRPNWSEGVKKTGAYEWTISRDMLNEQLSDLTSLGSEARIVPNYRGGKYQGFKLVGVRPGSLYRAIGIRSGDVVKGINGKPIDSPNKAIQLFEQMKSSSGIKLEIERRGQPKMLGYTIE